MKVLFLLFLLNTGLSYPCIGDNTERGDVLNYASSLSYCIGMKTLFSHIGSGDEEEKKESLREIVEQAIGTYYVLPSLMKEVEDGLWTEEEASLLAGADRGTVVF